jgi:hypothetical protein
MKLVKETRKIWGVRLRLLAHCFALWQALLRCAPCAAVGRFSGRDADDDYISPITDLNRGLGRWRHTLCTTLTLSLRKLAARGRVRMRQRFSRHRNFWVLHFFRLFVFVRRGADDDYNSPITDLIRGPRATGRQNVMHHSDAPLLTTTLRCACIYLRISSLLLSR